MAEEVEAVNTEVEDSSEDNESRGLISVEITDSNVRYDTNLSAPEVVFWLRIVEEMIIQKVMAGESEA